MAKKDAPNYRKAENPSESCSTCKAYDPDHEDAKPGTGHCSMYDFFCKVTNTCDAWTAKTENEGIYRIAGMLTDDPDVFQEAHVPGSTRGGPVYGPRETKHTAEQVKSEILKVNNLLSQLPSWNLKYDNFPESYRPDLPYGMDQAVKAQQGVMAVRSANYWGVSHFQSDSASKSKRESIRSWIATVHDLCGDYNLQWLYENPLSATHPTDDEIWEQDRLEDEKAEIEFEKAEARKRSKREHEEWYDMMGGGADY